MNTYTLKSFALPNLILLLLLAISSSSLFSQVNINIDWSQYESSISRDIWGVNDFKAKNFTQPDNQYRDYLLELSPGMVRIHQAGLIDSWSDNAKKSWNIERIKLVMDNAVKGYSSNTKVMICMSDWPTFIAPHGNYFPPEKEQELEDYFAMLPGIMDSLGYKIEYYEFLNENDEGYSNSIGFDKYAKLVARLARRFKKVTTNLNLPYTVMVGGPALRWPNQVWYQPAIDIAGADLDFFSWHHYAAGPKESNMSEEDRDLQIFQNIDWIAGSAITSIRNYAKSKGHNHLKYFMDEFNVQYVWTPYEKRHHNNVGAVWYATVLKRMAKNGLDGAMNWNAKDGAYGLLADDGGISAPGQLYLWGTRYFIGDMAKVTSSSNNIEALAVKKKDGNKNVLLINRSANTHTINNIAAIADVNPGDNLYTLKIDASTMTGKSCEPGEISIVDNSLTMPPWSLVLITATAPQPLNPVEDASIQKTLHNGILINWKDPNTTGLGYNIYVNDKLFKTVTDTIFWIEGLQPAQNYTIHVAVLNEFYEESEKVSVAAKTLAKPLKINDQTHGNAINNINKTGNWTKQVANGYYNNDLSYSNQAGNTLQLKFKGDGVALFGNYTTTSGGKIKISLDGNKLAEIDLSLKPLEIKGNNRYLWSGNDLAGEAEKVLTIEIITAGDVKIDYFAVFNPLFQSDTQAPGQPELPKADVTYQSISLSWAHAQDNTGVQGYLISKDGAPADTIFSPYIDYLGLMDDQEYSFSLKAFDVAGNVSPERKFSVTTASFLSTTVYSTVNRPDIDGEMDELWIVQQRHPIKNKYNGNSKSKAWYSTIWDTNYLYVFVQVEDEYLANAKTKVHMYLDSYNDKVGRYGSDDYWYTFNRELKSYSEYYNQGTASFGFKETGNGFNLEARYKWSSINSPRNPTTGYIFGFEIHIVEEETDPSTILTWNEGTLNAAENTMLLANMKLSDEIFTSVSRLNGKSKIQLYPNPVKDYLHISGLEQKQVKQIDIYNVLGIRVANFSFVQTTDFRSLHVAQLPKGIYFVRISAKNTPEETFKIIKE